MRMEQIKNGSIQKRIEIIVYAELVLGINRLYIIREKPWSNLVRVYALAVASGCLYLVWNDTFMTKNSFFILNCVSLFEVAFLIVSASFFQKRQFKNIFSNLTRIDSSLGVLNNRYYHKAAAVGSASTVFIIVYTIVELVGCKIVLGDMWTNDLYVTFIVITAHDLENVLYCYSMRSVLLRLHLIKAHVKKLMKGNEFRIIYSRDEPSDLLARPVQINISALHKIYEDLHTTSQNLNNVMGLPILVMLFAAGITSIFINRGIYELLFMPPSRAINIRIILSALRCVRYSVSVVFPCMVAHSSGREAQEICSLLRKVGLTGDLDPTEQRKVEAFSRLAFARPFHYSPCGLVRLAPTVPVSYLGLCTTYLVLLIQMSKFID